MSSGPVFCGLMHGDGRPHPPSIRCVDLFLSERNQYLWELRQGLPVTSSGYVCGMMWGGRGKWASGRVGVDGGSNSGSQKADDNDANDANDVQLEERVKDWSRFRKKFVL